MKLCVALVVGIILGLGIMARADALDDARRQTDQARQALNAAESRLNWALNQANELQRKVDDLRNLQNSLPNDINNLQGTIHEAQARVADAQGQLPDVNAALDAAKAVLNDKRITLNDKKSKLAWAQSQVDQEHDKAKTAFKAGPDFVAAQKALDAADVKQTAASEACLNVVMKTPEYLAQASTAAAAEADVRDLRAKAAAGDPTAQGELARASRQWIDAKGALEVMKTHALDDDPGVRSTQAEIKTAKGELQALVDQFEKNLPGQPVMAAALAERDQAKKDYQSATSDLTLAQATQSAAQKKVDEINRRQSDALAAAAQADSMVQAKQQQLDQVNGQLAGAQADAYQAQGNVDQARRARDDASRAYQAAQSNENQVRQQQQQKH